MNGAHLPGAIKMPPDQVQQLAAPLLPDGQKEVVVYCADAG
jgi:rhodanese-related sulfurtransferase